MDLSPDLINLIANGGLAVVVFVIWFFTFKQLSNQIHTYNEHVNKLYKMIEDDLKYKELLTGILTRLEAKLDLSLKLRGKNE